MNRALLDRLELLHDDLVADATALVALVPASARAWRPHLLAASVADVLALLDVVTARALDRRDAPWRDAHWSVRLSAALDPLRLRAPRRRGAAVDEAPERFLARQARVRERLTALRSADASHAEAEAPALARLLVRQRRLLDAALDVAERGGHLAAVPWAADEAGHATPPGRQAVAPRSAS